MDNNLYELIKDLDREQICEKYQISEKTAIRWQKKLKLYKPKINRLNYEVAEKIRNLFVNGYSIDDLVLKFSTSSVSVYRILNNETYKTHKDKAQINVLYNPKS